MKPFTGNDNGNDLARLIWRLANKGGDNNNDDDNDALIEDATDEDALGVDLGDDGLAFRSIGTV